LCRPVAGQPASNTFVMAIGGDEGHLRSSFWLSSDNLRFISPRPSTITSTYLVTIAGDVWIAVARAGPTVATRQYSVLCVTAMNFVTATLPAIAALIIGASVWVTHHPNSLN
jgi:hypothetical protein